MQILVTGRAGSGKTAVAMELRRRGFTAFDTDDVPGMSCWQDKYTGKRVTVADNSYVDLEQLHWIWDTDIVKRLLGENPDMFLCGGADNDLSFHDLFDHHFALKVSPETQIRRVQARTDNEYGKDPRMFEKIVANERHHVAAAQELGATIINAEQDIQRVVDTILTLAHVSGPNT